MTLADALRLLARLVHTGALVVWLGGGGLHLVARTALRATTDRAQWTAFDATWRRVARLSFWGLGSSGVYLVFDRLADPRVGAVWIGVLAVKLGVVAALWWILGARGGHPTRGGRPLRGRDPARLVLSLGTVALILGVVLTLLYEAGPRGP
ncbi:MAG: hypothetical protein M3010_01465 [Candidatus Dormibacteraeota bacterium]|nr:hypothetical protein [Candidatus Dormibacteraeota bacterium]